LPKFAYNHLFKPKRACGLTPVHFDKVLQSAKDFAPFRLITWNNHDAAHQEINDFKRSAIKRIFENPFHIIKQTHAGVTRIEPTLDDQTQKLDRVAEEIQKIQKTLQNTNTTKSTNTHIRQPLPDPVSHTIYTWLIALPRGTHQHRIPFYRFRISITLLFFTGMRAAEVAQLNHRQIMNALEYGHIDVVLAKTRRSHRYVFTQAARYTLSQMQREIINVFYESDRLAGNLHQCNWVAFLNNRIKVAADHFNLNISSHSFRAGYITRILRIASVHQVAQIVGHQDYRSTLSYNRYVPDQDTILNLLEQSEKLAEPKD